MLTLSLPDFFFFFVMVIPGLMFGSSVITGISIKSNLFKKCLPCLPVQFKEKEQPWHQSHIALNGKLNTSRNLSWGLTWYPPQILLFGNKLLYIKYIDMKSKFLLPEVIATFHFMMLALDYVIKINSYHSLVNDCEHIYITKEGFKCSNIAELQEKGFETNYMKSS